MRINEKGLQLLKSFEGCKLKAYRDVVGIWTIGYGHTGDDVYPGKTITQKEADTLLESDLLDFENGIDSALKVKVTENQFSALVVFTYNVGLGNFLKSHLLKYINLSQFDKASNEFGRWNRAGGIIRKDLTRRRAAERDLFLTIG